MEIEKTKQPASAEEEAQRSARNAARIRKIILVVSILAGIGLGLLLTKNKPRKTEEKLFRADGFQITLSTRFAETGDRQGYDRAYCSNHERVWVAREGFEASQELAALTSAEYADRIAQTVPGASEILTENGVTYFEYETENADAVLEAVYRGQDAFWRVLFTCKAGSYAEYREDYLEFAASVIFEESVNQP